MISVANAAVALSCLAISAGADAADWRAVKRIQHEGLTVEIDAGSLVRLGDVVLAWSRDTYKEDQLMFQRGAFMYRTSTVRSEFDCARRTFRLLTFFYADDKGVVMQRTTESETKHMEAAAAVPGTIAEAMLDLACSLRGADQIGQRQ